MTALPGPGGMNTMNNMTDPTAASDGAWTGGEPRMPVPNTSLLPDAEKTASPAVDLMQRVVRGAHDTIDRAADSAAPTVRQLDASLSGAENKLHAKADQLRETRDAWAGSLRSTVIGNPLASVAAALALGALLARIAR